MIHRTPPARRRLGVALAAVATVLALATAAGAGNSGALNNGNFERGDLSGGWQAYDNAPFADPGSWFVSNKRFTPLTNSNWKGPAEKEWAAVTDQFGPGVHVLYRTLDLSGKTSRMSLIVYYKNEAGFFCTPPDLDPTDPCNQQYRIDLLVDGAAPDSMNPADIVMSIFRTKTSAPSSMGPTKVQANLSGLKGNFTLRLAEVDNQDNFFASVDKISINNG